MKFYYGAFMLDSLTDEKQEVRTMKMLTAIALLFLFSTSVLSASPITQNGNAIASGEWQKVTSEQMLDNSKVAATEVANNNHAETDGVGVKVLALIVMGLDSLFVKIIALLIIVFGVVYGVKERSVAPFLQMVIPGLIMFNASRIVELTMTHATLIDKAYDHVGVVGFVMIMATLILMWAAGDDVKKKPATPNTPDKQ